MKVRVVVTGVRAQVSGDALQAVEDGASPASRTGRTSHGKSLHAVIACSARGAASSRAAAAARAVVAAEASPSIRADCPAPS